jgi:hypothetical protein
LAQLDHFVAVGVQLNRLRRVVVRDQHIATALDEVQHRVMHIERDQAAFDRPKLLAQARHPGREKGERQRVRDGKGNHVLAG